MFGLQRVPNSICLTMWFKAFVIVSLATLLKSLDICRLSCFTLWRNSQKFCIFFWNGLVPNLKTSRSVKICSFGMVRIFPDPFRTSRIFPDPFRTSRNFPDLSGKFRMKHVATMDTSAVPPPVPIARHAAVAPPARSKTTPRMLTCSTPRSPLFPFPVSRIELEL